jgi:hypothetical protein
MAKFNWNKVNQQNLIYKKGYEDRSSEIAPYQQCTEKQYQLIEKLINQSPKNMKLAKQFLFWDTKTNKLLPRKMLTKKYASILIDTIIKKNKMFIGPSIVENNDRGVNNFGRGV